MRLRQHFLQTDLASLQVCLANLCCSSTLVVNKSVRLGILKLEHSRAPRFVEDVFLCAPPPGIRQCVPALPPTMLSVA